MSALHVGFPQPYTSTKDSTEQGCVPLYPRHDSMSLSNKVGTIEDKLKKVVSWSQGVLCIEVPPCRLPQHGPKVSSVERFHHVDYLNMVPRCPL